MIYLYRAMWDVSDVHNDIKEHLGVVGSSLSRRIRGRGAYQQTWGSATERTSLLPEATVVTQARSAPACSFSGYNTAEAGLNNNPSVGESEEAIVNTLDNSNAINT